MLRIGKQIAGRLRAQVRACDRQLQGLNVTKIGVGRIPCHHKAVARLGLGLLLVILTGFAPATAQSGAAPSIQEIEITGLRSLTEDTLKFYLEIDVGQPFDPDALNRKVHELWDRQLIDDIQIELEEAAGGVRLAISVVERPTLRASD